MVVVNGKSFVLKSLIRDIVGMPLSFHFSVAKGLDYYRVVVKYSG